MSLPANKVNRSSSVDGISSVWLSLWLTEQKLKAIVMSAESSAVHRCLEFWTATVRFAWLVGQLILHQFGDKLNIACTRSVMKIVRSKVPVRVWIHEEKIIRTCSTFLVYREWTVLTCVVDLSWILHQTFFVEERSIAPYAAVAVCYHYTGRTFVDMYISSKILLRT